MRIISPILKNILFLLILLFHPLSAKALAPRSDWIYYGESSKSNFEAYYSQSGFKRDGFLVKVKIVKNYEEPVEFTAEEPYFKYQSSVESQVINCEPKVYRNIRSEKWTEPWGKGLLGKAHYYDLELKPNWSESISIKQVEGGLMEKVCFYTAGKYEK
jgi:hypothetical protein